MVPDPLHVTRGEVVSDWVPTTEEVRGRFWINDGAWADPEDAEAFDRWLAQRDAAMKAHRLDALLFPGPIGAAVAAKPGYPTVIVPFATVPNLLAPPGFDARPTPFGVSFTGGACSEPRLIELAYAFEQATKRRRPPALD